MDGQDQPFHSSYEDRGPDAPDRMFTAVSPKTTQHLILAWHEHLNRHRSPPPDIVHLHHLSHLQTATKRAYPGQRIVTILHGTDLKLLDQAQRITRFAARLATLSAACANPEHKQTILDRFLRDVADLTDEERAQVHVTDWLLWPYADLWSVQMQRHIRQAGRIVVVSESDRAEVSRLLGTPRGEVTVVPKRGGHHPLRTSDSQRRRAARHLRQWLADDPRGWAPGQVCVKSKGTLRRLSESP